MIRVLSIRFTFSEVVLIASWLLDGWFVVDTVGQYVEAFARMEEVELCFVVSRVYLQYVLLSVENL